MERPSCCCGRLIKLCDFPDAAARTVSRSCRIPAMAGNLRRAPLQAAAAALLLVSLQPFVSCAEVRASSNPPGGLKPSETPQFILWS